MATRGKECGPEPVRLAHRVKEAYSGMSVHILSLLFQYLTTWWRRGLAEAMVNCGASKRPRSTLVEGTV